MTTLTPEERERIRSLRESAGMNQRELATAAGVSSGTISNLESGRSRQVRAQVYADVIRALHVAATPATNDVDAMYRELVSLAVDLDARGMRNAVDLIRSLRATR